MVVECDNLVYTPINALTFKITGNTLCLNPVTEDNIIIALEGPEELKIQLGLTVEIKKIKYKVNIIEKIGNSIDHTLKYHISLAKRTKSSVFIMPMLPGSKQLYFWNKLFVNCFIATQEEEDCIALLYRWSTDLRYIKFEKILTEFKFFKRRYDPTSNYVMFIFNIPPGYKKELRAFKMGKYSKFSKSYKVDILEFHNADIQDEIGQILFKSEERKQLLETKLNATLPEDSELLSIITIEEEKFDPEIYKLKKLL